MENADKYGMKDKELNQARVECLAAEFALAHTTEYYLQLCARHFWMLAAFFNGAPDQFEWAKAILDDANDKASERLS